jgi:hypothetical protein
VTWLQYAGYVLRRLAAALLVALGAALLAHLLQLLGCLEPVQLGPASAPFALGRALHAAGWWVRPAAWAALAHVLLGPKQSRPVYLRSPGAMYVYAGVRVSREAGCRGGLVTGSTGSGKTLCCIVPRLHSLCVNEPGAERDGWAGSRARAQLDQARARHRALSLAEARTIARLGEAALEARRRLAVRRAELAAGAAPLDGPGAEAPALHDAAVAGIREGAERRLGALQALADACRPARFLCAPWGGFVCGEKGNEWRTLEGVLRHHGREEDLCVLATRPPWASEGWLPPSRLNLIGCAEVPADTYAQMIVDTALAVEESGTRDEFFVSQARDKIAWGIRLVRAAAARRRGPNLVTVLDILTVQESYRSYLLDCAAECPALAQSEAFLEARYQLENSYWSQPPEQLGGVRSTVHNFLAPYAEPEVAQVFCADSTLDLRDVETGKVVCLALPQRLSVQRRYVSTLIKALVYRIILERYDRQGGADWADQNVILVEQDEWQRHAVRDDCGVDVVREARGAVYAATQSQNAVWLKLGGRDRAAPLIANLRNRWICQAATDECAAESSGVISSRLARAVSFSSGDAGRTTSVSFAEAPFVPAHELRILPPFQVLFAPAEGPWLYRRCIAMPATPDGRIPPWWFGDWNPLHWVARAVGLPELLAGLRLHGGASQVPPWRARAPWRAQLRFIAGLDGTFIVLGQARSAAGRGRR